MMSSSIPTAESQENIGPTLMLSGTTNSHPYYRSATSPNPHEINVLCMEVFDSSSFPFSIANEQQRRELITLCKNNIEVLKEKLRNTESFLSILESYVPRAPQRHFHTSTLVSVYPPVRQPNLDVIVLEGEPTLKELQTLSTIDEGTGQKFETDPMNGQGSPTNSAPTLAEMEFWCPISDR